MQIKYEGMRLFSKKALYRILTEKLTECYNMNERSLIIRSGMLSQCYFAILEEWGVLKMPYIDDLLNDVKFIAKQKRTTIKEAFEVKKLPIKYGMSANMITSAQLGIILQSMELAAQRHQSLADREWLAWLTYVHGCTESSSDKVKRKATRILNNILPVLTRSSSEGIKLHHP